MKGKETNQIQEQEQNIELEEELEDDDDDDIVMSKREKALLKRKRKRKKNKEKTTRSIINKEKDTIEFDENGKPLICTPLNESHFFDHALNPDPTPLLDSLRLHFLRYNFTTTKVVSRLFHPSFIFQDCGKFYLINPRHLHDIVDGKPC